MNTNEKAAFIQSQATAAMIEAMGMQALNEHRKSLGQTIAYDDEAFVNLIEKYGLGHNSVLSFLQEKQ